MSVLIRTRSPVSNPSWSASIGFIHNGCPWLISYRYLALPDRVWIRVGSRKMGSRMRSRPSRSRSRQ